MKQHQNDTGDVLTHPDPFSNYGYLLASASAHWLLFHPSYKSALINRLVEPYSSVHPRETRPTKAQHFSHQQTTKDNIEKKRRPHDSGDQQFRALLEDLAKKSWNLKWT